MKHECALVFIFPTQIPVHTHRTAWMSEWMEFKNPVCTTLFVLWHLMWILTKLNVDVNKNGKI